MAGRVTSRVVYGLIRFWDVQIMDSFDIYFVELIVSAASALAMVVLTND
jgi:hypothetical protein